MTRIRQSDGDVSFMGPERWPQENLLSLLFPRSQSGLVYRVHNRSRALR